MPKLSTVHLTKRTVEAIKKPAKGDRFVWDDEVRGFGLRVYASDRRLFVYQYQMVTGVTRRKTLGEFPAVTVEDARKLAKAAASKVASGHDPQGDELDALQRRTFAEVFPEYLSERRGELAPRTVAEYERLWAKTLSPAFGSKRVAVLDLASVTRWHSARAKTPTLANRAVDLLSSLCAWSERHGYRPRHSNPCVEVQRYKEARKGRSLTAEEYRRLGSTLDAALTIGIRPAERLRKVSTKAATKNRRPKGADKPRKQNPAMIAALRFLALSGWREQEVLSLRWDAINLARGVAVLADTKSGRSQRPLGEAALDVLRAQPPHAGNPFVFPGDRVGSHVTEIKRVWQSVKEAAQLEESAPFRLHDLRHSFTTVARDELCLGDHAIAGLVGHTLRGQTSRYGEVRDATLLRAASEIAATIEKYLNGTETKVLPFASKAENG